METLLYFALLVFRLDPSVMGLPFYAFCGVKRREREADSSPPFSIEFKDAWTFNSLNAPAAL
jgi:FPC/CPF motif-containing protein YcgG